MALVAPHTACSGAAKLTQPVATANAATSAKIPAFVVCPFAPRATPSFAQNPRASHYAPHRASTNWSSRSEIVRPLRALLDDTSSSSAAATVELTSSETAADVAAPASEQTVAALAPEAAEAAPVVVEPPKKPRRPLRKLRGEEKAVATGWGWDGRSARDLDALERWLTGRGLGKQKVALRLVKEGGRGLVATQAIGKGESLLDVPESLIITADTVYSCPCVGTLLQRAGVPEWPALAAFLLSEAGRGAASPWHTYIDTLPRMPPCILQWSVEEVDVLLRGSPTRQQAIECISDVTNTYLDLNDSLFSNHRDVFPERLFSLGNFKWAFAILFSRLVRLPSQSNRLALVPWGDMLNHRCEAESYLDFDSWRKSVALKTDRAYAQGQEVYASYGPKSNGELLLAYGVVPATFNPHDSVPLLLALSPDDPLLPVKEAALQANGLSCPLAFPLRMSGLPSQLLSFARLVAAGPSVAEAEIQQLAAASSMAAGEGAAGRAGQAVRGAWAEGLEVEAREVVLAAVLLALNGYKTSLKEDELVLAGVGEEYVEDDGEQRVRVRAAAALRCSERRILLRSEFVLRSELREQRAAAAAAAAGKRNIKRGNNFGGESASLIGRLLRRIAQP